MTFFETAIFQDQQSTGLDTAMSDSVILSAIAQAFTPKDRTDQWNVFFGANTSSGYDFSLVIENPATKVSYEIEVGIMDDGRLCGQITPDEGGTGPDALVLFDTTPDTACVQGNWGGAKLILSDSDRKGRIVSDDTKPTGPLGFH
jgi:hypothetical protein